MPPPVPEHTPAVRLVGPGTLEFPEVPLSEPGPGEVMLRVLAVGLCGSDAHWYEEGRIGETRPGDGLILGHEFCGVIESGPRSGQRVVADPAISCLDCDPCSRGDFHLCAKMRFAGHGATDGALRTLMAWPERCLVPIPDSVADDQGALLEPLGVALHAIDLGDAKPGMSAGIIGCGPIGLLVVTGLLDAGLTGVEVSEPLAHRRMAAEAMGAAVIPPGPDRLDLVFECAGTDAALEHALEAVRPGGRVVVVGIPSGDATSLRASLARRKEVTIVFSRRMLPDDLTRAVAAVGSGRLDLSGWVTHRYPLAEAESAFETLVGRRGIKVVVRP